MEKDYADNDDYMEDVEQEELEENYHKPNTNLEFIDEEGEEEDTLQEALNTVPELQSNTSVNQNEYAYAFKKNDFNKGKYSPKEFTEYFPEVFWKNEIPIYFNGGESGPSFICLHGAGHSALSFAVVAKHVKSSFRLFSFDFRGHGNNKQDRPDQLSKEQLIEDAISVIDYITSIPQFANDTIVLVGHSMGGSIATFTYQAIFERKMKSLLQKILALLIIDVVEGTAMDALPFMEGIVNSRPKSFESAEEAIEYMYKSSTIQNLESARVSVPPLIEKNSKDNRFHWKTDLLASKIYWRGWFEGLTSSFLNIRLPKILLLAGSERMDKELTIAHMQGKFKMIVLSNVGHLIQEDNPKNTAITFIDFVKIFKIPSSIGEIKPIVGKIMGNEPQIEN